MVVIKGFILFRFDLKKALESSKKLPNFAQKMVDVDALESRFVTTDIIGDLNTGHSNYRNSYDLNK